MLTSNHIDQTTSLWNEREVCEDVGINIIRAVEDANIRTPNLSRLLRVEDKVLNLTGHLEQAILTSTPTTPLGIARKLETILAYPWETDIDFMGLFIKELRQPPQ